MIGVYVTVPIACFRKGLAREYLETEPIPPPSTCYGFLLALVGETDRRRHCGVRLTPVLLGKPHKSVVLRTVWRVKSRPLGSAQNTRPDYQQILTGVELVIWMDSADENNPPPHLEARVASSLDPNQRGRLKRFGGLSLGESTHLVDQVRLFPGDPNRNGSVFLLQSNGPLTLPVWVDHVGSSGTRFVTGELVEKPLLPPPFDRLPRIEQDPS